MLKTIRNFVFFFISLFFISSSYAVVAKGIYLSQLTLENTTYLNYLIKNSKEVGINTFIIDFEHPSEKYEDNISLVKQNDLKYVARIVMFPGGGTDEQIKSRAYWEERLVLAKQAIDLGADEIQLDYIRYNTKQKPSPQNALNVLKVIQFFKSQLEEMDIPLQIDVFGISSFKPSKYIGQDIGLFANEIDTLCPMLYPSHFEPFKEHAAKPYDTIFDSLTSIKKQLNNQLPFKIISYIELQNYHYKFAGKTRLNYIKEQIRAVEDAKIHGWYAWSANNAYDRLFEILRTN